MKVKLAKISKRMMKYHIPIAITASLLILFHASLPAYKRVLKNISENIAGIKKFEKYLEKAVKNELSSKQATKEKTPSRKKYIREEMVPRWLKNGDHEHQKDQRMEKDSESRRLKLLEDFRNLNKKEPIGC